MSIFINRKVVNEFITCSSVIDLVEHHSVVISCFRTRELVLFVEEFCILCSVHRSDDLVIISENDDLIEMSVFAAENYTDVAHTP